MERLRLLRLQKNMSQKDLADVFKTAQTTISKWEKGDRTPDPETLMALADFFNCTTDYLLGRDEAEQPSKEEKIDEIMKLYNDLSEDKKEQVKAFIKFQASQN